MLLHQPFSMKDDLSPSTFSHFVVTLMCYYLPLILLLFIFFMLWELKDLVSNIVMATIFWITWLVLEFVWSCNALERATFWVWFLNFWHNLVHKDSGKPGKLRGKLFFKLQPKETPRYKLNKSYENQKFAYFLCNLSHFQMFLENFRRLSSLIVLILFGINFLVALSTVRNILCTVCNEFFANAY